MARHSIIGRKGEGLARSYLENKGYTILENNWHYRRLEIDIIAKNEEFIIFVEVKSRSSSYWGNPEEAVTHTKIKRIIEAADFYIGQSDIALQIRFDVISILFVKNKVEIIHFEDAFFPTLY